MPRGGARVRGRPRADKSCTKMTTESHETHSLVVDTDEVDPIAEWRQQMIAERGDNQGSRNLTRYNCEAMARGTDAIQL